MLNIIMFHLAKKVLDTRGEGLKSVTLTLLFIAWWPDVAEVKIEDQLCLIGTAKIKLTAFKAADICQHFNCSE
jgi:hypothetical protein